MDAADLPQRVRDEQTTELSRLGSSKSLYADTGGDLEPGTVLAAAADAAHHAAETFEGWAADGDDAVADAFADVAATEREHADAIAADLEAHEPGPAPAHLEHLAGLERDLDRVGGLLGWTLVLDRKTGQRSGFFTGQADPGTASLFRGFGDDHEAHRDGALDLAASLAQDPEDLTAVVDAAVATIGAAYGEFVETLEDMGINPKPVC